ncbi:hypothetical protein MRX96_049026 [Rhipicephalus microplus]
MKSLIAVMTARYTDEALRPDSAALGSASHPRIEDGEKSRLGCRYCCESCDYEARVPALLKMHVRTHTGERPVLVPSVPQQLCTEDHSDKAPTHTHELASIQVLDMPAKICHEFRSFTAPSNSLGRTTVQVPFSPREFFSVVNSRKSSPHPYRRASV